MSNNWKVSIIGQGNFGKLLADIMPEEASVITYDNARTNQPALNKILSADIVFMAVPLAAYDSLLPTLAPMLPSGTLVVDVCSVKTKPAELIKKHLPRHKNILMTHPLFGPQSAKKGHIRGHQIIVTEKHGASAEALIEYFETGLGLEVSYSTNELHDKAMAQVHAVTFFIAKALSKSQVGKGSQFTTPSFRILLDLIKLENNHTSALFETIQLGNPYAAKARLNLLDAFNKIQQELQNKEQDNG